MIMKEDFVSYEIAIKLKEKGFDEPCNMYYHIHNDIADCVGSLEYTRDCSYDFINSKNKYRCSAPTISQVLKWLRERETRIDIVVYPIDRSTAFIGGEIYTISIYIDRERDIEINRNGKDKYRTYEQAALAGIEYVLDNLV